MNARDDSALGRFWAEALGWTISSEGPSVTNLEPEGFTYPDPIAVCIDIIAVPEPKAVKNRVHVVLATTSVAHEADLVARLKELGAAPADVGQGERPVDGFCRPGGQRVLCPHPALTRSLADSHRDHRDGCRPAPRQQDLSWRQGLPPPENGLSLASVFP